MATKAAPVQGSPVQSTAPGGGIFVCTCGRKEQRQITDATNPHLICGCGRIYTTNDIATGRKPLHVGNG